jgi:hypothetical protein
MRAGRRFGSGKTGVTSMKRLLLTVAALAVLATSSVPASALNPQPLPPKVFKVSDFFVKKKNKHFVVKHRGVR